MRKAINKVRRRRVNLKCAFCGYAYPLSCRVSLSHVRCPKCRRRPTHISPLLRLRHWSRCHLLKQHNHSCQDENARHGTNGSDNS